MNTSLRETKVLLGGSRLNASEAMIPPRWTGKKHIPTGLLHQFANWFAMTVIFLIRFYQIIISPLLHSIFGVRMCRYRESCSEYAIRIIKEKGIKKGFMLSLRRLLSCQPFGTIGRNVAS